MTISSEIDRVQFAGSGTTGPFTISSLEIQDNTQVAVTHTDSVGVNTDYILTTDYTINTELTELTTVANVESGETLTVVIDIPLTQGVDYKNTGTFDAEVNEDALDKLTLQNKQQAELLARTVKFEVDSTASNITLPDADTGKALLWASDGNLSNSTDDFDSIVTDAAASAAAAAVSETNAGSSASSASSSASAASTSASNASTSETNAATSETNAGTSETNAATSETNAATSETNAETAEVNAESAASSVAINWAFDSTTTMADPGTGDLRLNNATVSSVTAIAASALTAETGNPDLSDYIVTWDDSTSTNNGTIVIRKRGTPATFAVFNLTGAVTDNTTWLQLAVTYVDGAGTFSAADDLYVQFIRTGDKGEQGPAGTGALDNVVDDLTPQLGGNLDVNGKTIVSVSAGDIILTPDTTGDVIIDGLKYPQADGNAGEFLQTNASGQLSFATVDVGDLTDGTDGELITWDASGVAATVSAGTSTHILTSNGAGAAPTFQAAAGGGSWTLLDTQTASSSSNINIDSSIITSTYKKYIIEVINLVMSSDGDDMRVRLSEDNGSTVPSTSGDYAMTYWTNKGTISAATNTTQGEIIHENLGTGSVGGESQDLTIELFNPSGSGLNKRLRISSVFNNAAGELVTSVASASYTKNTNAINYLRLFPTAGTITSGTIKTYGVI